jgi:hypothetical protein
MDERSKLAFGSRFSGVKICPLQHLVNKSCHHEFEELVELDCQSLWQFLIAGISPLKVIWNTEFTSCCDILESKFLWQILEQCR